MRPQSIALIATLLLVTTCTSADEVRIITSDRKQEVASKRQEVEGHEDKAEIVRQFFEFEGVSLEGPVEASKLELYDGEPLVKMRQLLANRQNFLQAFTLNAEINQLLYEKCKKRVSGTQVHDSQEKVYDEAVLQTMELMVPDSSWSWQVYAEAKEDLRQFCLEQATRCQELLSRLRDKLEAGQMHTMDAITALESYFHAWIPLARLSKYLEDFGDQN